MAYNRVSVSVNMYYANNVFSIVNTKKDDMHKNTMAVPRLGWRARLVGLKESLCTGAEWTRKSNASFFGTLDVGEFDG